MAPKPEFKPVEFYSKAAGLEIAYKRPVARPDGTTDPGQSVRFQNHFYMAQTEDVAEFLKTRTINGGKVIGSDYWLLSEMDKYLKKVPEEHRNAATHRMKDDKIARLEATILELKTGKAQKDQ